MRQAAVILVVLVLRCSPFAAATEYQLRQDLNQTLSAERQLVSVPQRVGHLHKAVGVRGHNALGLLQEVNLVETQY